MGGGWEAEKNENVWEFCQVNSALEWPKTILISERLSKLMLFLSDICDST